MGILIGIDIGTTNWKAAAFSETGMPLHIRKTPAVTRRMENGCCYYEPEEIWTSVCTLLRQLMADCAGEEVLGVSVTSMSESVVPVDRDGKTLFPVIAWFDASAKEQAARITDRFGEDAIFSICGLDPDPIFSLPKIMWVRDHYPDVYEKADKWLQMMDYICFRLCGECATDYSMACRTLAFDLEKRSWSRELLDAFDIPVSVMPALQKAGTLLGTVSGPVAEMTGLPSGTRVFVGGHDHPCATITAGVLAGNRIMDSSGTAESLLYISQPDAPVPKTRQGARIGMYLDPRRYVLWGGIKASGASADWAFDRLAFGTDWLETAGAAAEEGLPAGHAEGQEKKRDYAKVLDALQEIPAGAEGLIYIPHLRGSGAPSWNQNDRGAFLGLTSLHDSRHMLRAVFEGLSFQARIIVEMHEQIAGTRTDGVCVAGGSARNRFWQQVKADILQRPVELSPFGDATVQGAALLAGIGAGLFSSVDEASAACAGNNDILLPDPSAADIYNRLYRRYRFANDAACSLHRQLSDY